MLLQVFLAATCLLTIFTNIASTASSSFECGACMLLVHELETGIAKIDPKKTIQIGSFRVDPKGNQQGLHEVPYARSEAHLVELIEDACTKSSSYKLVAHPTTGKSVFKHNDATYRKGDTSKNIQSKLHNACNDFVDSHEDTLTKLMQKERSDPTKEICHDELSVCSAVDVTPWPSEDYPEPETTEEPKTDPLEDEL